MKPRAELVARVLEDEGVYDKPFIADQLGETLSASEVANALRGLTRRGLVVASRHPRPTRAGKTLYALSAAGRDYLAWRNTVVPRRAPKAAKP